MKILTVLFAVSIALFPVDVGAHSGGLNAQGCHAGSQPYHCHRSSSAMVPSSSGGYRLRCDLGSRSKDCLGASSWTRTSTFALQRQIRRHCTGLGSGFVDGMLGANTTFALMRFQSAYGLVADGLYGAATVSALNGPVQVGACSF